MDIVYGRAVGLLYEYVQRVLQRAYLKLRRGVAHLKVAVAFLYHKGQQVALRTGVCGHGIVPLGLGAVKVHFGFAVLLAQLFAQPCYGLMRIHAEHNAVYGLELYAGIVHVFKLHQRIARGMVRRFLRRKGFLYLLPVGLCRGEGMVAVAHGEKETWRVCAVLGGENLGACQCLKRAQRAVYACVVLYEIALYVAAALHQLKIVAFFAFAHAFAYGLDYRALGIVYKHQYVRQLHRRVLPYAKAGRYTLNYCALRGAYKRG